MAIRFYFQPDADALIVDYHYVPYYDCDKPFWYLQMKEALATTYQYVQWPYFAPGQENYPLNFLCKGGPTYIKSQFVTQGTDLWDALQAEGLDQIPHGIWTLVGWFIDDAAIPDVLWSFKIEVYKRTPDTDPSPSPSPSEDVETKLFEWTTSSNVLGATSHSYSSPYKSAYSVGVTDKLVVKIYAYRDKEDDNVKLRMGYQSEPAQYHSYIDLPETPSLSPSPSPSPSLDWVDEGNLLAPVEASVRLNSAKTAQMFSETGHEPKFLLDDNPNTYWKPSSTADHTLWFDLGQQIRVDAFAMWLHNYNAGLGKSKAWRLSYLTDEGYISFDDKLFIDSRNAGVPLIAFVFEEPVTARYWKLTILDFDEVPSGPLIEIGGVWFLRDYSLPYDNQYPEPQAFEWGNDIAISRSGDSYQERRFRGHVQTSNKEYVFVQQAHSDLLLNAYKASKGGLLPIAFKPDYDSINWILCRFTSRHSLQETWSEVFQPRIEVRELGFKRVPYMTKTLPALSTTVAHWKFDESLADSSGNNHTLTAVDIPGGAIYDYGICDHNKTCIMFDDDGLLNLDAAEAALLDMGTSDFSLEMILATATVSETIYLIHKFGDSPSPPPSPEPSPSPLEAGYYVALTTAGKLNVCVGDGSNEVIGTDYGTGLDDGVFHCIAVTVDRTNDLLKVYVDGVQVGSNLDISSITGAITNAIEPFQIGGENLSGNPKCIIGPLDEACVSKQLLSATLIASRHAGYSHDGSWRL